MKALIAVFGFLFMSVAIAGTPAPKAVPADAPAAPTHRFLVERTFPAGALAGLDAAGKAKVNATNARFGVTWVMSYANADQTKTYCIYEGPSEEAIREAAKANALPVDSIAEIPVTLESK
jgi:predicted amidohydrolase YtcJ